MLLGAITCLGVATWSQAALGRVSSLPIVCDARIKPGLRLNNSGACEAIRAAMSAALRRPVHLTGALPRSGDHLRVGLRLPRQNALELSAQGRIGGRSVVYGPVAMDVVDRPLLQSDLDRLASRMAESLAQRR